MDRKEIRKDLLRVCILALCFPLYQFVLAILIFMDGSPLPLGRLVSYEFTELIMMAFIGIYVVFFGLHSIRTGLKVRTSRFYQIQFANTQKSLDVALLIAALVSILFMTIFFLPGLLNLFG